MLRCNGIWLQYATSCRSADRWTRADAVNFPVAISKTADKVCCRATHAAGFLVGKVDLPSKLSSAARDCDMGFRGRRL